MQACMAICLHGHLGRLYLAACNQHALAACCRGTQANINNQRHFEPTVFLGRQHFRANCFCVDGQGCARPTASAECRMSRQHQIYCHSQDYVELRTSRRHQRSRLAVPSLSRRRVLKLTGRLGGGSGQSSTPLSRGSNSCRPNCLYRNKRLTNSVRS